MGVVADSGERTAEPKSALGTSTSCWPGPACKRQLRRERGWDAWVRNKRVASSGRRARWPAGNHDHYQPLVLACMTACEGESLRGRLLRRVACSA